jgi:hypothetical protein
MFDRLLREMLESTLPRRNFTAQERIKLPLPSLDSAARWELRRPDGTVEPLEAGFVSRNTRGVSIERPLTPGVYRVAARTTDGEQQQVLLEVPLAISAPAEESRLDSAAGQQLAAAGLGPSAQLLAPGETISLAGPLTRGEDCWWWLLLAAALLLLLEMLLLWSWRPAVKSAAADAAWGGGP